MTIQTYSIALASIICSNMAFAESPTPYSDMSVFLRSEPVSLEAIGNNWNSKYYPDGENQIASAWLESGVKKGNWSYGAIFREENQLKFHSESADLYYAVIHDQDLIPNKQYQLDLDTYRFRGYGARVSRMFSPNTNLQFTVGASLFYASNLFDGYLSGTAAANSGDEYTYQFEGDYQYDEDVLLDRKGVDAPAGIGLSLDLATEWKPTERLRLNAKARDIAGVIYWKDAPFTQTVANSDTVTIDEDGFSNVNPAIQGIEGYKSSYTQNLRPSLDLSINYTLNNSPYSIETKSKHYRNLNLFSIGGSKQFTESSLALHYWPTINTLELNYTNPKFDLSLALDTLDLSDTRTFWLNITYQ